MSDVDLFHVQHNAHQQKIVYERNDFSLSYSQGESFVVEPSWTQPQEQGFVTELVDCLSDNQEIKIKCRSNIPRMRQSAWHNLVTLRLSERLDERKWSDTGLDDVILRWQISATSADHSRVASHEKQRWRMVFVDLQFLRNDESDTDAHPIMT